MIKQLVRKQIKGMKEINWGDIPSNNAIRLLWGENPLVIKKAIQVIKNEVEKVNFYPSPTKSQLKEKLAKYNKVLPENIVPTNGSDEAIELIAKVFLDPKDEVIIPIPSYPCFSSVSQMMGAKIKKVPLESDFSLNIGKLSSVINPKTKIVWIANPNNPTGNILVSQKQLEYLAKKLNCLLVVDECYFELAQVSGTPLIKRYPNVVVIRSFSKVFALAGARLGYIIANKKVTSYLNRLQQSNQVFNVNRFAQAAAITILKNKKSLQKIIKNCQKLKENFEKLLSNIEGVEVILTKTTFCLLNIKKTGISAAKLKEELEKEKIYIKDCSIYQKLGPQYIYLGIPSMKDQKKVFNSLKNYLNPVPDFWIKPEEKDFFSQVKAVVFDIDRTLANITDSYEKSIRAATAEFLKLAGIAINFEILATEEDLYKLWQRPQLADVWYLTYALTSYYLAQLIVSNFDSLEELSNLSSLPSGDLIERVKANFDSEKNNLEKAGQLFQNKEIVTNFFQFVPFLLEAPGMDKIEVILNATGKFFTEKGLPGPQATTALQKIWSPNLLKALFQQMFMDERGYQQEYGPSFISCRTYWSNDQTTIPQEKLRQLLKKLATGYSLGIATARPKLELNRFLETFALSKFFQPEAIISLESGSKTDRIKASLAALSVSPTTTPAVYLGDTSGDSKAVQELIDEGYQIRSIGVGVALDNQDLRRENFQILQEVSIAAYIDSIDKIKEAL